MGKRVVGKEAAARLTRTAALATGKTVSRFDRLQVAHSANRVIAQVNLHKNERLPMSRFALNDAFAVIAEIEMSPSAKVVLLALANRHNQETGRCDPGMARICSDTLLSEATVRRSIRDLENLGVIATRHRKQRYAGQKKNLTNSYIFAMSRGGLKLTGGVGSNCAPKREDTRARETSRPFDLAMVLEDDA